MFVVLVDHNSVINIQGLSVMLDVFCYTAVDAFGACVKEMLCTWDGIKEGNNKRPVFVKASRCTK